MVTDALLAKVIDAGEHQENASLRRLVTSSAQQLNQHDVRLGLKRLEDIIEAQSQKGNKLSQVFRTYLSKYGGTLADGLSIGQCGFKTRFSQAKERGDIQLIIPIDKNGEPKKSPVIQGHTTVEELKKQLDEYYQEPIDAIIRACRDEMQSFEKLRKDMDPLVERNDDGSFAFAIPDEVRDYVLLVSASYGVTYLATTEALLDKYSQQIVLAAFLQITAQASPNQTVRCPGKSLLILDCCKAWFPKTGSGMQSYFWTPFLLPNQILLICFIRLMIHTTWNKDVIAGLRGKDLPYPLPAGRFFLQGYKDKVEKNTSEVEVAVTDHEVRETIELLGQHYENMVELGFSPTSVWETPWSKELSFLNNAHYSLISRYKLPKFYIEQLAKHMINVRKTIDGDIRQSQAERNHSHVKTTAGYVDHPLARAFYDAHNAEFQRRFEATVQFRHDGAESLAKYGLSKDDIDLKLLVDPSEETGADTPLWFQLGDGSTCTDIWAPIDKAKKSQKICGGRLCHAGDDGCPHNRVILGPGPEPFANTLRKQRWFIERCDSLLQEYTRAYFDEYIVPEMRFVFGLARFVETANPEMYRAAKKALRFNNGR